MFRASSGFRAGGPYVLPVIKPQSAACKARPYLLFYLSGSFTSFLEHPWELEMTPSSTASKRGLKSVLKTVLQMLLSGGRGPCFQVPISFSKFLIYFWFLVTSCGAYSWLYTQRSPVLWGPDAVWGLAPPCCTLSGPRNTFF